MFIKKRMMCMRVFMLLAFLVFLSNEARAMWQEEDFPELNSMAFYKSSAKTRAGKGGRPAGKRKKVKGVPLELIPLPMPREQRFIKELMLKKKSYPVYDRSVANEGRVSSRALKALREKVRLGILQKVIAGKRLGEMSLFEGGSKESAYLKYEKVIKPTTGALNFGLPNLCENEPDSEILERRIQEIFGRTIETQILYVDPKTRQQKTRSYTGAFFSVRRLVAGGRNSGIRAYFAKEAIWDGGLERWHAGGAYAQNQMGRRLDRFLTFFERRLLSYDSLPRGEEKMIEKQKLNRLAECLASFEEKCIDRAFSALDEMERLMVILEDSMLMRPFEGLVEKARLEKEEKLIGLALHDYKKFLLAGFSEMVEVRSGARNRYNESREAYLRYLLLTQRPLGLGDLLQGMHYRGAFQKRHKKPFHEIIQYVVSNMSVESFLYFISATTAIPDELRQWDYHVFVGEKTNFDEIFSEKWGLWEAGKEGGLWTQVEEEKNKDPYFKVFYEETLRGEEEVFNVAYQALFAQTVKQQAFSALERLGYLSDHPYYCEPLSFQLLYG